VAQGKDQWQAHEALGSIKAKQFSAQLGDYFH
jgi:hypothetical protein